MMEFKLFDDWGPEKVVMVADRRSGMKGVLVLDNTARGMGKGGTRMSATLSVTEVSRLARTMTWKWAAADLYFGGAKAGILGDPNSPHKEQMLRAFARALKNEVPNEYYFGLDMGLNESDAAILFDELGGTGAVGLPTSLGGLPYDELGFTGYGLVHSCLAALQSRGEKLEGSRFAIQGLGAVGLAAAQRVADLGGAVIAASTHLGSIQVADGLDIGRLVELQQEFGDECVVHYGAPLQPPGSELVADCDVLMVCAREDVLDAPVAAEVQARLVMEGANMASNSAARSIFHERHILVIPDFIGNAGGIVAAAYAMETRNSPFVLDHDVVYDAVRSKLESNTLHLLREGERLGATPHEAALAIARERVHRAMVARGQAPAAHTAGAVQ